MDKELTFTQGVIYDITVTNENITDGLHKELIRLLTLYGPQVRTCIAGFALGPNAYKCFEHYARERCRIPTARYVDCPEFEGHKIFACATPFIQVMFNENGWHYAHMEAKRFIEDKVDA